MQIMIDHHARTVRPLDREGDRHYGLVVGSNGTAAINRRALVDVPDSYEWRTHSGAHAIGPLLVPGGGAWVNPWDGVALAALF